MPFTEVPVPRQLKESFLSLVYALGGDKSRIGKQLVVELPVYALSLRGLAVGQVASRAKQAGWQFLTIGPDGATVSGEAPITSTDKYGATSTRSRGPTAESALAAFHAASNALELQRNSYELRALRIPGLHIEALWLRKKPDQPNAEQFDSDLVIPFRTFDPELASKVPVTMKQFVEKVRKPAELQLAAAIPKD